MTSSSQAETNVDDQKRQILFKTTKYHKSLYQTKIMLKQLLT